MSEESHYGNYPKCPKCGHEEQDAWELDMEDDDAQDLECGECEHAYRVSLSVSYTYESRDIAPPSAPAMRPGEGTEVKP